ncbi:MAG: hypothetical protein KY439_00215 [Actinobacteria bacterium]|nr:hypothetical protein [Actinomycetota bacterium]
MAELFIAPPEEFVARRDQLARELRQAGDKAAAAEIKSLRRPTPAAWAVNQLAAAHRDQLWALVALGDRLRRAHEAVLEGGGTAVMREVTAERRRLVAELAHTAVELLGKGGEAQREAISQTLDAAVADRGLGELVRGGRLAKQLAAPSGFGDLDLLVGQPGLAPADDGGGQAEVAEDEQRRAGRRRRELERREREARLERLRGEAARKEAEATRALEKVQELQQEMDKLARPLEVAQQRAASAGEEAAAARTELEREDGGG